VAEQLHRYFHFKIKRVRPDIQRFEHVGPDHLEPGLHVGQHAGRQHVAHKRQHLVADIVPEEKDPMGPEETRAVNGVSPSAFNELEGQGIFFRMVLKIGILNDNDVSCCPGDPGLQRLSLSLIPFMRQGRKALVAFREPLQNVAGSVCGAVVNNDDLFPNRNFVDPFNDLRDGVVFVEGGNDHRQDHRFLLFLHESPFRATIRSDCPNGRQIRGSRTSTTGINSLSNVSAEERGMDVLFNTLPYNHHPAIPVMFQ